MQYKAGAMKLFHFTPFLAAATIGGMAVVQSNVNRAFPLGKSSNDALDEHHSDRYLAKVEEYCVELGLAASLATIKKMRQSVAAENSREALRPLEIELQGRLLDEMTGKIFWALNTREAELYNHPRNGWEQIIERFPDTVSDIEEASKCFALSRYAAAIFHSVQTVEVGLIELGKIIGVTDPLSGWTATTNRLQSIIKKGHEARTLFEREHFAFFEQMHGTIEGLKNAWRNKISHAHGKLTLLTADFSPDVAEEILFASRAFMRRLATDAPSSEGLS